MSDTGGRGDDGAAVRGEGGPDVVGGRLQRAWLGASAGINRTPELLHGCTGVWLSQFERVVEIQLLRN